MSAKFAPLKAGNTFSYAGTCKLPAGAWSATCQVRSADGADTLLGVIGVTLGDTINGVTPIALYASASETAAWPLATHRVDIRFTEALGGVANSASILLPVIKPVTVA